jgi:hypothetical protein
MIPLTLTDFRSVLILLVLLVVTDLHAGISGTAAEETPIQQVLFLQDAGLDGPALHGLQKLQEAVEARGLSLVHPEKPFAESADFIITAGLKGSGGAAEKHLKVMNIPLPEAPEAMVIQRSEYHGKPALVLCGADEVGLMYALLDVADRLSWPAPGEDPFSRVENAREQPHILDRAVSKYTMQRAQYENFLHDESHMERYFDMLAASRINSFVLIFGYENGGFMAPAYPYFFDVDGFPEVELVGITPGQQARNTEALKRLIEMAHERGIRFCPAFWDHIYRGAVQGGGIPGASEKAGTRTPHLVSGVTTENLVAYNKAAIARFLQVFPDIDAIQFRMHWESGLTREETPAFWHDMFAIITASRPDMLIDLRAKGLPDEVIEDAIDQGLNFRITTKYWMEQLGLPFHPTHINTQNQTDRRHGYADLLRYPKRYRVHWRMWNGGTTRMLLWGDPEYVRRFCESAGIYGGNSFEVNEMLATKMLSAEHDAEPFDLLNPGYQYYDFEFERYWYFYQLWGRVGYRPDTPSEVWEHAFSRRFGKEAGQALMEGLHLASRVLPRIVAASYPYRHFPTTRGWAEMQRQLDLPDYAKAEGSDIQQFMNTKDFAEMVLAENITAKRTPLQTSRWFSSKAAEILEKVRQAEEAVDAGQGAEFISTVTDLRILAGLARYHAHRLLAGFQYNLYLESADLHALDEAISLEKKAREAWAGIVEAAGDVYTDQLIFGVQQVGFNRHWKDELVLLDRGLSALEEMRRNAPARSKNTGGKPDRTTDLTGADDNPPEILLERAVRAVPGRDLSIHARVSDPADIQWMRLRYRHLTQFEDYASAEMELDPVTGLFTAEIPGEFIVPEWDLMYFIEVVDIDGNGRMIPDLEVEMPYVIVRTAE